MTGYTDRTETLIEKTLAHHAEQAPSDGPLLHRVHGRLRRRRLVRSAGAALVAASAVAASVAAVTFLADPPAPPDSNQVAGAPDGWRWESYRTIEVQVPDNWGYGVTNWPSCVDRSSKSPYVGRPGVVPMIACGEPRLADRVPYLWFGDRKEGVREYDHGWVEETKRVDGVSVTVFSDDDVLRRRILDSIQRIDGADAYGCTPTHPAAERPESRPASNGGLDSVGTVSSVTICRYSIVDRQHPLVAGSRLTDAAAGAVVDAIVAAPAGSGPNDSDTCSDAKFGREILVLDVRGSNHDQVVVLRFSGCDHNGTDDGEALRRLTAEAIRPILAGPHFTWTVSEAVGELLR